MQTQMQQLLSFSEFYNEIKSQKLSIKTAYRLAQLNRAIENELQFYQDKVQSILQEYGEHDENGQLVPTEDGRGVKLMPGTEHKCYAAMAELQSLDVELPDIKFNIEEFGEATLSPEHMEAILPFIEE